MNLPDSINLVQIQAASDLEQSQKELTVAVGYLGSDGTAKLCGNRCLFHIESGRFKDRCTLLGKDVVVPNLASCSYYAKGEPAEKWANHQPVIPVQILTPEQVGLVSGKVQCKRCVRSNGKGVCNALTAVLRKVLGFKGATFKIEPDACCN